jgi:hypothetical protein
MIASDGAPADLTAENLLLTSSGLVAWRNQVVNVTPRATSSGRCAVGVNLLEARTAWALNCGTCGNTGRPPDKRSPATRDR